MDPTYESSRRRSDSAATEKREKRLPGENPKRPRLVELHRATARARRVTAGEKIYLMKIRRLAMLCLIFCAGAAGLRAAAPRPPNIIFFLIDDWGWTDAGSFG